MVSLDGARIIRLRQGLGFSQDALAERTRACDVTGAGVSARVVWDAEKGNPVSPRTRVLLARALGVSQWTLLPLGERLRRAARFAGPASALLLLVGVMVVAAVRMEDRVTSIARPLPSVVKPIFDDMRDATTLATDATLGHDLLCNDLTILPGVVLDTNGHNIFCSGTFMNKGVIVTGNGGYEDLPGSYGGAGGDGCGDHAQSGSVTIGRDASPPPLSGELLRRWYANGLMRKLAGAAGGGNMTGQIPDGGAGAYGLYIQAHRIDAGFIRSRGSDARLGGGGGAGSIVLAYGDGGLVPGRYVLDGGRGWGSDCDSGANGGSGHVAAFAYGEAVPIDPVRDVGFVASVWHEPKTAITALLFSGTSTDTRITLHGYGFGRSPFARPFKGVLADFRVADPSGGRWEAGYDGDQIPLRYERWDDHTIVVSGLDIGQGDCIEIGIWNPWTGAGAAWGGNAPGATAGTPRISNVYLYSDGEMTVVGSGFGKPPAPPPFENNRYLAFFGDLAYHPRNGNGESVAFTEGDKWTDTKLLFEYWSDTRIEIAGFTGPAPPSGMFIESGDPVSLIVWNPQKHLATAWGGFAQ